MDGAYSEGPFELQLLHVSSYVATVHAHFEWYWYAVQICCPSRSGFAGTADILDLHVEPRMQDWIQHQQNALPRSIPIVL